MSPSNNNIILIGFMGSGKSCVGELVAALSNYTWIDTDSLIETEENTSISTLFKTKGEPYFREKEHQLCEQMLSWNKSIISTGGGLCVPEANQRLLQKSGHIMYLNATFDTLMARIENTHSRPLLQHISSTKALWDKRRPIYSSLAHTTIHTDTKSPEKVASEIWETLEKNP